METKKSPLPKEAEALLTESESMAWTNQLWPYS